MKYTKIFRQVYEPYLSKLGYFWYKKYFIRVDPKQELLSLVCHRNYSKSGPSQYAISVGAGHFPLGGLDVDKLDLRGFDSVSDILHREMELTANRKPVQFTADDCDEVITREAFEASLNFLLTYCPDLFEVGEIPDNLEVYNRIINRLAKNGLISEIVTKLGSMPMFEFETYIWTRDYEKAKRFNLQYLDHVISVCDESINSLQLELEYINGNSSVELLTGYELKQIKKILKNPIKRKEYVEMVESQIEYWVKSKIETETFCHKQAETLEKNPESLRKDIDELRRSNLIKLAEFEAKSKKKISNNHISGRDK
jgi:hypothetical protein